MSASLVGSEMCIRDRNGPLESAEDRYRGCFRLAVASTSIITVLWLRQWPVSYTHLTLPTICSV
eukprot:277665-Alexandrium_andersonii.AAC.1